MGTEGQGSREKRGSRGRAAGLLGRRLLPREEPRPGQGPAGGGAGAGLHPAPPLPAEMLANQSAVCLGDGQEPVEGGPVCGAAGNCPGAESAQTPPSARGRPAPSSGRVSQCQWSGRRVGGRADPPGRSSAELTLIQAAPRPGPEAGRAGGPRAHQSAPSSGAPRHRFCSWSRVFSLRWAFPHLHQSEHGGSQLHPLGPCFPASKVTHSVVKLY